MKVDMALRMLEYCKEAYNPVVEDPLVTGAPDDHRLTESLDCSIDDEEIDEIYFLSTYLLFFCTFLLTKQLNEKVPPNHNPHHLHKFPFLYHLLPSVLL